MNSADQLKQASQAAWANYYRASTAAGVWFLALAASIAIAKWTDGASLAAVLFVVSISLAAVNLLHALITLTEAQTASSKLIKELNGAEPGSAPVKPSNQTSQRPKW